MNEVWISPKSLSASVSFVARPGLRGIDGRTSESSFEQEQISVQLAQELLLLRESFEQGDIRNLRQPLLNACKLIEANGDKPIPGDVILGSGLFNCLPAVLGNFEQFFEVIPAVVHFLHLLTRDAGMTALVENDCSVSTHLLPYLKQAFAEGQQTLWAELLSVFVNLSADVQFPWSKNHKLYRFIYRVISRSRDSQVHHSALKLLANLTLHRPPPRKFRRRILEIISLIAQSRAARAYRFIVVRVEYWIADVLLNLAKSDCLDVDHFFAKQLEIFIQNCLAITEDRIYRFIGVFARSHKEHLKALLGDICLSDLIKSEGDVFAFDDVRLESACWAIRQCLGAGCGWKDQGELEWILGHLAVYTPRSGFQCKKEVILLFFESLKAIPIGEFRVELREMCFAILNDGLVMEFGREVVDLCLCALIQMKGALIESGLEEGEEMELWRETSAACVQWTAENGGKSRRLVQALGEL
jgi:hypothetical protein